MNGRRSWYDLATPELVRVRADGSSKPEGIVNGKIKNGNNLWFFWMRQPVISPDGHTIAVVSDGTDPLGNDVVMQFYDTEIEEVHEAEARPVSRPRSPGPSVAA